MNVLIDTNVVLDHILLRKPFANAASVIFTLVESGQLNASLCATTITTIHYLASKSFNQKKSTQVIHHLLKLFEVAPVNRIVVENAIAAQFSDFEDAVVHESAVSFGAQAIITRDRKVFKKSNISIYTPKEIIRILYSQKAIN